MVNAVTNLIQIANSLIFNRILTINGQVSQIDHMSDQSWILLRLFGVKNHQILEIFIWQMLCYLTRNALFFMFLGFLWMIAEPSILDSNYFIKIWEQKMEAPLIENWKEIEGLSLHQILHLWPLSPRFSLLQIWPIYAAAS